MDAAESCILSSWRKLRVCEELFSILLSGISQTTISRGVQLLRVLLIPLKPLVLTTCAQVIFVIFKHIACRAQLQTLTIGEIYRFSTLITWPKQFLLEMLIDLGSGLNVVISMKKVLVKSCLCK